jgi:hypothetical protein
MQSRTDAAAAGCAGSFGFGFAAQLREADAGLSYAELRDKDFYSDKPLRSPSAARAVTLA